ncbi:MFS transporter [Scopulibacillus cellulosilyticus]|uniref:MFS transporter n=1 Tax=Scopulibacillus cellulosilyticus TaxID=2665665 RepID=A0ABW2PVA7_9BACL
MESAKRKLTWKNFIGYGATDLFGGGFLAVMSAWMLYFYTTFCGLSPIAAGSIIGIARIVDAIASPTMGYITDSFGRTRLGKKFGKRRFFLLLGMPLMALYALMWISGMNYWYYLITYLLMEFIAAMILIPYETLASEMTNNFNERTKLSSVRLVYSGLASTLATYIPSLLFGHFGKNSPSVFFFNGLIFAIIFFVALFVTHRTTWDREETITDQEKVPFIQSLIKPFFSLASTFRIKSFRQHLLIYICSFTAMDVLSAVFVYFIVFALHKDAILAANLLTICAFLQMVCTPLYGWLVLKIGPSNSMKVAYTLVIAGVAGIISLYLIQPSFMVTALYVMAFLIGLGRSGLYYIPWNIYPFIPDVDEIVTRQRREGVFAGIMTFVRKSTTALATFIVGAVLSSGGFVDKATTQSPEAIHTIIGVLIVGNIGLLVISFIVAITFKLSKKNHTILLAEVNRLKNNGPMKSVDAETRNVVEALTGWKYEKLWGNNNVAYWSNTTHTQDFKKSNIN